MERASAIFGSNDVPASVVTGVCQLITTRQVAVIIVISTSCVLAQYFRLLYRISLRYTLDIYTQQLSWHLGQIGVLAFFVHTSLVLMLSLERMGHSDNLVASFYIRRCLLIDFLNVVCVLVTYWLRLPSGPLENPESW